MTAVRSVIIAGGGIAGLTAAIGLQRLGIQAHVYERTPELLPLGAGMTLWNNAMRALAELDLDKAVGQAGAQLQGAELTTRSGRVMVHLPANTPNIGIHRAALHRVLLENLQPGTLHLGLECSGYVEDGGQVTALFTDGSSTSADLLIGADGLHSAVRRQMHPRSRLRYAGYGMYTGVLDTPRAAGITHMQERWGRGRRFGRFPISAGQISWFVTANLKEGNPPPAQGWKAFLQEHYRDWPAEVRSFIEDTPAERIIPKEIYDAAPLRRGNGAGAWYTRRAVLLGDAAHPTTPNMGQGGCQAIESAALLVRCLGEMDSLPAALRRYQNARWPQARLLTFQSRQIGQAGQFSFPLLCAVRDAAGLLLPDALLGIPFRLIVDHRI